MEMENTLWRPMTGEAETRSRGSDGETTMLLQIIQPCDVFHLWNVLFDDVDNSRHEVTFPECDMDAVTMEIGVVEQVLEIQRLRRGIVALAHANLKQVRVHTLFGTP